MRVLILSQYFWPENFRINELARELSERGYEVCVLTGLPNYPKGAVFEAYRRDPRSFTRFGAVDVVRVPLVPRGRGALRLVVNYSSFACSALLVGAWKLRRRSFDRILVFQPSPATIGLPSVVLRALKRAPTIFWVQDLWPDTLEAIGVVRSHAILKLLDRFVGWVYAHSDHVLAQSKAFLPRLRRQVPAGVPVSYLPNWAEMRRSEAPAAPPESGKGRESFNIFYLGNLGEAQDLPAVLDAIEHLAPGSDIHWYFVGEGRTEGWLRREVSRRRLSDHVHMLGAFPPEDMPRFHAQADALLVSLKANPLFALTVPSKIQSYLAAGVPILGMLDGEGARVIEEAGAGITCRAGDSRALADAALQLSKMAPAVRVALGRAGLRYSLEHFSFPKLVARLEAVLRNPAAVSCAGGQAFE